MKYIIKTGRQANMPKRDGTLHVSSSWYTRLWLYAESLRHGVPISDIIDELVFSLEDEREYDPEAVVQRYIEKNDSYLVDEEDEDSAYGYEEYNEWRDTGIQRAEKKMKELERFRA